MSSLKTSPVLSLQDNPASKEQKITSQPTSKKVKTAADLSPTAARPADTPTPNSTNTIATWISANSALQIVGVVANISGILSSAAGIYSFIEGFLQPSNASILSAIQQLQQIVETDFASLGDLITQQIQVVVDTVNRDAMAAALANSATALERIQDFIANGDNAALDDAKTLSSQGLQFFNALGLTAPGDLAFFMPGLTQAGTARILTFAAQPVGAREPYSTVVNDLTSMVNLMGNMLNAVSTTINGNHGITVKSHVAECPVIAQIEGASAPAFGQPHRNVTVIDGYYHVEGGLQLAFFDAQQGNLQCEQPSPYQAGAEAAAQAARVQGVTDELAFLGIPNSTQILQAWSTLLNTVSTTMTPTVFDLNGTWASRGTPGPVITVDGNSLSIDMSVYNRPTAAGSVVDSSHVTVTFPDANTYTATLQPAEAASPDSIHWSNDTTWTRA